MFSNNANMNVIGSMFYTLDWHYKNIIKKNGFWVNEAFLRDQLKIFNIQPSFHDFEITF